MKLLGILSVTKKFKLKPTFYKAFKYVLTASMQWRDTFLDCTHQHVCGCQADHDTTAEFGSIAPETIKLSVTIEPLDGSNRLAVLRLQSIPASCCIWEAAEPRYLSSNFKVCLSIYYYIKIIILPT